MRSQTFLLLEVAVVCASASAIPASAPAQLTRRDPRDWLSPDGGNLNIIFSDDTIRLGTVTIDSIMDKLQFQAYHDEGLCDTGDIELEGELISGGLGGEAEGVTITVHPSGGYPIAKCEDVHTTPTCPNPMVYCPMEPFTVNECVVPRYWGIALHGSDSNAPPSNIQADMTFKIEDSGLCETFATVGSAFAGAINGGFGGVFTLGGLLCQILD
ncbi:hypothetical protein GGS20DRAFT_585882 [Poronia punctata]|nr:hypothetical protein GGS20DRAFT_585882 [Poronia punctata]